MSAISRLDYCNPFVPGRIALEREALGPDFNDTATVWSKRVDLEVGRGNIGRLIARVEPLDE